MLRRFALCLLLLIAAGCSNGDGDPPTGGSNPIQLTVINTSQDPAVTVAVFQKNLAVQSTPLAWQVFSLASSNSQFFTYDPSFELQVKAEQIESPFFPTGPGEVDQVTQSGGAIEIRRISSSSDRTVLEVENGLTSEAIDALIYRGEELLAKLEGIQPHERALFKFPNSLHFISGDYNPGDPINPSQATEISLLGIKSADIVIGGSAASAYTFAITNVVYQ